MMKKFFMTSVICALAIFLFCACSKKKEEPKKDATEESVVIPEEPKEPEESKKAVYINPITGEASNKKMKARPLIVSYDNVGSAVPQSWTSMADIVYEFPVEANLTRLQAIFYSEIPEFLGPVRSVRPYFVDLVREYKGVYLAHGWSDAARDYLKSGVVPYINAMDTDCKFYRVSDKKAPHNSYIKWSEVEKKIKEKGWWDKKQEIRPFQFLDKKEKNVGEAVDYVEFDSANHCEFTYDASKNYYVRTVNGKEYVDKETGKSVTVSNVLVQKVSSRTLDAKGRLSIDMCSGGDALLFTNGVVVEGTWSRKNLDSRTIFKDKDGKEFKLSVGNTWVMVAHQKTKISYKTK